MKKNFKYFGIVWLVVFVLFNAITFLIPNEVFGITRFDKAGFWIAYALITVAFIAQLVTAYIFVKDDSAEKTFLHIPLIRTGYAAVIVSAIVGLIFMIFPVLPAWIGAIVCLLIAGYFAIACVNAGAAANAVEQVGQKVKEQTQFMKMAVAEAANIIARATTEEIKAETKKVYEALRYSDYMSNPALETLESAIDKQLKALKSAVADANDEEVKRITKELLLTIQERNVKCKLLK